ncbi:DUF2513 domain-containing protein [Altererythrobacter sp. FM1]|jgi:hypothetical protein|uniref:DUF2513 domain-containing protein n=1 Tax=Tsuneonella flava TaxID=2055955 RepID=UPI000C809490|nr:DUF2513 domain-containing protein [Tsuneonella flava]ROT95376.1 DUF2513 domain-containing protein [Altererythrobacter sp. FM1]
MGAPFVRDMDLIRSLLLEIEDGKRVFETISDVDVEALGLDPGEGIPAAESARLEYHLELLADAGFIEVNRLNGGVWRIKTLTWAGQEFLGSIRDGKVWKQAKAGAAKVGNNSITFVWELAKAYGKQLAVEKLGITLG